MPEDPGQQQNQPHAAESDVDEGVVQDGRFTLDLPPDTRSAQQKTKIGRARTANVLAYILVGGAVISPIVCLLTLWVVLSHSGDDDGTATSLAIDAVHRVFDKWYAIVSPLAGAAVGVYYGGTRERTER